MTRWIPLLSNGICNVKFFGWVLLFYLSSHLCRVFSHTPFSSSPLLSSSRSVFATLPLSLASEAQLASCDRKTSPVVIATSCSPHKWWTFIFRRVSFKTISKRVKGCTHMHACIRARVEDVTTMFLSFTEGFFFYLTFKSAGMSTILLIRNLNYYMNGRWLH